MSAFAFGDPHPPVGQLDVAKAQAEDLAAAQSAEQHRQDHGPVAVGAQGTEKIGAARGIEDSRECAWGADQRGRPARSLP